jgi:hypothetical protein
MKLKISTKSQDTIPFLEETVCLILIFTVGWVDIGTTPELCCIPFKRRENGKKIVIFVTFERDTPNLRGTLVKNEKKKIKPP